MDCAWVGIWVWKWTVVWVEQTDGLWEADGPFGTVVGVVCEVEGLEAVWWWFCVSFPSERSLWIDVAVQIG